MNELEIRLRQGGGAIQRKAHRDISGHLDRMVRNGTLMAILPGVYCATADQHLLSVRIHAAALWAGPDAILTGRVAAHLTFWPRCRVDDVALALPNQNKRSSAGLGIECRRVPPTLTRRVSGLTVTAPALTAVDLAAGADGGNAIDEALRTGAATLGQMWDAFYAQPCRPGNAQRRLLLEDSRDEPWSEGERLHHRLLRGAGIGGWRPNRWVTTEHGVYCVDTLFRRERLVLEIDGWETHGTREAFEADRKRRNHLVLAGYQVLNFTWRQLVDDPDWVLACVRAALGR